MTLKDIKVGQAARVTKINGEGAIRRRIMDMGIVKGVEIFVRKAAPLGDPIELNLRGYELSMRKDDASIIEVEPIEEVCRLNPSLPCRRGSNKICEAAESF